MLTAHNPLLFLAQDRELAEEAWAGDIIGIPNHGNLRIGDALTEGEEMSFIGIPSFAPELMRKVRPEDPLKAKHLGRALLQIAEEGAARVFKPVMDPDWIVGVVGSLQFDVLADRIRTEYDIPVRFEATSLHMRAGSSAVTHGKLRNFAIPDRPLSPKITMVLRSFLRVTRGIWIQLRRNGRIYNS